MMTKKLLWCSDSWMLPTGYSQVSRNLLDRFYRSGIEVHNLSFQNGGFSFDLVISDRMSAMYKIYHPLHPNEFYGNNGTVEYYNNMIKPDYTAFLADSFMIKWLSDMVEHEGKKIPRRAKLSGKTLFYFPFDSDDVYDGVVPVMEQMDVRVAMSRFAQNLLKKKTGIDSHYIPHACDTNIYRPLPKSVVDNVKKENKWDDDVFVVGCVGRNQSRKNLPALMEAFAKFSEDKNTILLLHADPADPQGTNLFDMANKLNIKDKVVYGMQRFSLGVPEMRVNLAYNVMDIHALSTTGEGFGLPIIESMAAGTPNVVTNCTTTPELLGNWGERVRVKDYIVGSLNTKRSLVDVNDMVKKMNKLYDNPDLRKKYSENGRRHVLEHYNWEKITRMWLELLEHGEVYEKP